MTGDIPDEAIVADAAVGVIDSAIKGCVHIAE